MTVDCCVFKILRRSMDGKYLMRFQSKTCVFKFLPRSVGGASRPSSPRLRTVSLFLDCGIAASMSRSHVTLTCLLVLRSSPGIFEEKSDYSHSTVIRKSTCSLSIGESLALATHFLSKLRNYDIKSAQQVELSHGI